MASIQSPLSPGDFLPPEGDYESRDALFNAMNKWAATRGYAFTTGKSTTDRNGRRIATYACDRHCLPPPTSSKRGRNTTTQGTGCQYSVLAKAVLAKESLDKTAWTLKHRTDKRFSSHNHELSQHPSAHPVEPLRIESRLQSSSIPREPSQFEVAQRALSTCSKCHRAGHIMASRKCPLRYSESQSQPPSAPSASPAPSVPAVPTVPEASPVPSVPAVSSVPSVPSVPSASSTPLAPGAPYDSPQAVYQRYTASRSAWYAAQPRGSIKTDQQYRKAMGLPIAICQNELRMGS